MTAQIRERARWISRPAAGTSLRGHRGQWFRYWLLDRLVIIMHQDPSPGRYRSSGYALGGVYLWFVYAEGKIFIFH
jgi:hypothetical protein